MTRKDPSPVDLETAAPATGTMTRRSLVARAALAGLAGALVVDQAAFAAVDDSGQERPNVPTDADRAVLDAVIGFELAASDLYRITLERVSGELDSAVTAAGDDAETSDEVAAVQLLATAIEVMAENHQAYAQTIAGITGLSAGTADESFVAALRTGFEGSNEEFFTAAHALEQTAVATHTDAIGDYESADAIELIASILIVESRHATVLADLLGVDDLDVLFGNDQEAISLAGDA